MKHIAQILTATVSTLILFSCHSNETVQSDYQDAEVTITTNGNGIVKADTTLNGTPGLAKQLVENNTYIDIDITAISESMVASQTGSRKIDDGLNDKIAQAKAAIHRFYSHVTLKDNQYVLDNCTAKDLNMSESLFTTMKQNIDEMNEGLKQAEKKGYEIVTSQITEEYLKSLLE